MDSPGARRVTSSSSSAERAVEQQIADTRGHVQRRPSAVVRHHRDELGLELRRPVQLLLEHHPAPRPFKPAARAPGDPHPARCEGLGLPDAAETWNPITCSPRRSAAKNMTAFQWRVQPRQDGGFSTLKSLCTGLPRVRAAEEVGDGRQTDARSRISSTAMDGMPCVATEHIRRPARVPQEDDRRQPVASAVRVQTRSRANVTGRTTTAAGEPQACRCGEHR